MALYRALEMQGQLQCAVMMFQALMEGIGGGQVTAKGSNFTSIYKTKILNR